MEKFLKIYMYNCVIRKLFSSLVNLQLKKKINLVSYVTD